MLHCCCGNVVWLHACTRNNAPFVSGVPASRHIPRGGDAVIDDTNEIVKFWL